MLLVEGALPGHVELHFVSLERVGDGADRPFGVVLVCLLERIGIILSPVNGSLRIQAKALCDVVAGAPVEGEVFGFLLLIVVVVVKHRVGGGGAVARCRQSVFHVDLLGGRRRKSACNHIALVVVFLLHQFGVVDTKLQREILDAVDGGVCFEVVTLETGADGNAVVIKITQADRIGAIFGTSVDAEIVVLPPGLLEELIAKGIVLKDQCLFWIQGIGHRPVSFRHGSSLGEELRGVDGGGCVACAGCACAIEAVAKGTSLHGRAHDAEVFFCIEELQLARSLLMSQSGFKNNAGLSLFSFLRGDENDTVRSTCAINGCGCGIFQDREGLNVGRIQSLHGLFDPIDDDQRVVGKMNGRSSTDTKLGFASG